MKPEEIPARDHVFMVRTNAPIRWPDFIRLLRITLEAVIQPYDGAEAVIWKVPQPRFKKRVTPVRGPRETTA